MSLSDYIYIFNDITDEPSCVAFFDNHSQKSHKLRVIVKDEQLLKRHLQSLPALIADLVDLAVAVYVADRLSIRRTDMSCKIEVVLPVRHPEVLGSLQALELLRNTLYWYTGDYWSFDFKRRTAQGRLAELQSCLPFADITHPLEVALWSGGLDSLAGLCQRLSTDQHTNYTLLGTGSNNIIHHTQWETAEGIKKVFPNRIKLIQVPFRLDASASFQKSSAQRSRGFVFMLLGTVCAYLEKQDLLHIYENGVGAINLPFRPSEVGLDHARSVHPISLLHMSELVSSLINQKFIFRNPFLFQTKAQMCGVFTKPKLTNLISQTITCDHLHRDEIQQCGRCSSCLLRRQALLAMGIEDKTKYLVNTSSRTQPLQPSHKVHLSAMLYQVNTLHSCLSSDDPWRSLTHRYPILSDIVDRVAMYEGITAPMMEGYLIQMYQQYVREWKNIQDVIRRGLLDDEILTAS